MNSLGITIPSGSRLTDPSFIYGVATSSFQIEGAADARAQSIWDVFCLQKGTIKDGSDGREACEHVRLWQEDLALIHSLNVDAYRFSISWPRWMNDDGTPRADGIAFYDRMVDRLLTLGLKPFVTLYHWDLPQVLGAKGGWLNRETAFRFQEYVEDVARRLGDRIFSFATLNEPYCSAYLSYELGIHAPGETQRKSAIQAAHHLLLAHGLGMQALRTHAPKSQNGVVLNFSPCHSASERAEDVQAAQDADAYFNQWYLQPLMEGRYPSLLQRLPVAEHPIIESGDMAIIQAPLDYLGVNYYTRGVYFKSEEELFTAVPPRYVPLTEMGWEVYPEGLTEILTQLHERYALPPVYITENGAAFADEVVGEKVNDHQRVDYFDRHLLALHHAVQKGVDVRGYFAWSLMDNFEWAEGYAKRFGLVHVDYKTQKRTLKASALAYQNMLLRRRQMNGA